MNIPHSKTEEFIHDTCYDIHCHIMTFSHPTLFGVFQEFSRNFSEDLRAELFSKLHNLGGGLSINPLKALKNFLAVVDNDIPSIINIMEDDLAGKFIGQREKPFIHDGKIVMREKTYSRLVLTPLVMDFSGAAQASGDIHYSVAPHKSLQLQVEDLFSGIREYYRQRPQGLLDIYPFLGLNLSNYTAKELTKTLKHYFSKFQSSYAVRREWSSIMSGFNTFLEGTRSNFFAGIKLYPPLGFDPWPQEEGERKKRELFYEYCCEKRIPVTTHCDDQGYRTIPLHTAWEYTSPDRWEPVLELYPELKINFAHLGNQHYHKYGVKKRYAWYKQIIEFMKRYDHVYGDVAYNGADPDYYVWFKEELEKMTPETRKKVNRRVMFGTDFPVCLTRIKSYYHCFQTLNNSPLSNDFVHHLFSENPRTFLFTDTSPIDKIHQYFIKK